MTARARFMHALLAPLVATVLVAPPPLNAEELLDEWVAVYDGPGQEPYSGDWGQAIARDQCGNIYVAGKAYGVASLDDYTTIKYDSQGNELWVAVYNGPANASDGANAIALDPDGSIYVTGMSDGIGTSYDFATIKYDADGHQEWIARYDGGTYDPDRAYDIAVDDSGNVYVTGNSGFSPYSDYATIKYDTNGQERWVARYDGPRHGSDWAYSIAVDNDGCVYVVGTSEGDGTWDDIATVKYDSAGHEEWVIRHDGPMSHDDSGGFVMLDGEGCAYVSGTSTRSETGGDWVTIKYKPEGYQEWIAWYTGPGTVRDGPGGIFVSSAGDVWVTGGAAHGVGGSDLTTVRYNRRGKEVWVATYDGPANSTDAGFCIALDADRNVWVAGLSRGTGGDYDWATIRYDSLGQQQALARYDGPGGDTDVPYGIVVDESGSAYVTGRNTVIENDADIVTIKYSVVTGIAEQDPAAGLISSVGPSPFQQETTIEFVIPAGTGESRLGVYNVRGQLVKRFADTRECGRRAVSWDGTDMCGARVSSGVYFVRLYTRLIQDARKVVVLR